MPIATTTMHKRGEQEHLTWDLLCAAAVKQFNGARVRAQITLIE